MSRLSSLRTRLGRGVRSLASRSSWSFSDIFGHWQWESPAWFKWVGLQWSRFTGYLAADRKRIAGLLVLLIAAGTAFAWYELRPRPDYVEYSVSPPPLTTYDEMGIQHIRPMRVDFIRPVAPLKNIEKAVTSGIDVSPAFAGTWFWVSDRELQFTPRDDWPIDAKFKVRLASKGFLADLVLLEDYKFSFATEPFSAKFTESQFYQDPRDPNLKNMCSSKPPAMQPISD